MVQMVSQGRMVALDETLGGFLVPEVIQDIQGHKERRVKREIGVPLVLQIYM